MNKETDWSRLKTLNCARCSDDLQRTGNVFRCLSCPFVITEARLREIVEKMFTDSRDHFGRANFEDMLELSEGK